VSLNGSKKYSSVEKIITDEVKGVRMRFSAERNGFTMLEMLVAISIIGISSLAVVGVVKFVSQSSSQIVNKTTISNFKNQLQSVIDNPEAWSRTIDSSLGANSASLQCIKSGTDCRGFGGAVDIYSSNGSAFYMARSASAGFNTDGSICNTFSQDSSDCAFRYEVQWQPACPPSGACKNPLVFVTAELKSNQQNQSFVSTIDANFKLVKSYSKNTIERNCKSVGGLLDAGTKSCIQPTANVRCPAGQMVGGLDANKNIICIPMVSGACTGSDLLIGFDPKTGSSICVDKMTQIAVNDTNDLNYIRCKVLNRAEGEIWENLSGEVTKAKVCDDKNPTGSKQILFCNRFVEMTCISGLAKPTGRFRDEKLQKTIGVCENVKCSQRPEDLGKVYYWTAPVRQSEKVSCPKVEGGTPQYLTVVYDLTSELQCIQGLESYTGKSKKYEVSRSGVCPDLLEQSDLSYKLAVSSKSADKAKILIVVDDSSSMENSQANLSSGLNSLFDPMEGKSLDVKVITTSPPGFVHPDTGKNPSFFSSAVSYFIESSGIWSTVDALTFSRYGKMKKSETKISMNSERSNAITGSATKDQFLSFKLNVKNSILSVGTRGSPTETGLCNILLSLYDEGPNQFFQKGDIASVVIISDENDNSRWLSNCYNLVERISNIPVTDSVVYNFTYFTYSGSFDYTQIVDGVTQKFTKSFNHAVPFGSSVTLGTACSVDQMNFVRSKNSGITIDKFISCSVSTQNGSYSFADAHVEDRCSTAFTFNSVNYSNFEDASILGGNVRATNLRPGSCTKKISNTRNETNNKFSDSSVVGLAKSADYVSAISNKVQLLFGKKAFFLTNIITTKDCYLRRPVGGAQVESTAYIDLGKEFINTYKEFPICESNYSSALKSLSESLTTVMESSVVLDLPPGAQILKVFINRLGSLIELSKDQYDVINNRITVKDGFRLNTGDTLQVSYATIVTR